VKKVFCVFLAVNLCFGTLSACTKPTTQNSTTTAAATTADTTSESLTEATTTAFKKLTDAQIAKLSAAKFIEYTEDLRSSNYTDDDITDQIADLTAKQFLNYLKINDLKNIIPFIGANDYNASAELKSEKAYSFFRDFHITGYEMLKVGNMNGFTGYKVVLNISQSRSEFFPTGTCRWTLEVGDASQDMPPIHLFKQANKAISILADSDFGAAVDFCYYFSESFYCFQTLNDFNKLTPSTKDSVAFNDFCFYVIAFLDYNSYDNSSPFNGPIKRTLIEKQAKNVLGITNVDWTKFEDYNKKTDSIEIGGRDGSWLYDTLSSVNFDSSTRQYTVVIDFYADAAYILKAKTMKYIVSENADGSLTLLSTALLFDSGVEIASGSM